MKTSKFLDRDYVTQVPIDGTACPMFLKADGDSQIQEFVRFDFTSTLTVTSNNIINVAVHTSLGYSEGQGKFLQLTNSLV